MTAMFDSLEELTEQQRATVKERYRFLLREYRYRCRVYAFLFYLLRLTMTVGSLAVPALLSLKVSGPDGEAALYWFTWGLSLAVTTANGITTLFKLDKRFFMLHAVAERLRTETWQYLSLSGRYSGHYGSYRPSHRNQYVYYCSRLEKIRMSHIDEEYVRPADGDKDKHPPLPTSTATATGSSTDSNTADGAGSGAMPTGVRDMIGRRDSTVPTPPDQALMVMSPQMPRGRSQFPSLAQMPSMGRRDSTSTVGSDETVVQMADAKEAAPSAPIALSVPGEGQSAVPSTGEARVTIL